MAVSINHATRVINVPQADLTLIAGTLFSYDVNVFRLALKDLEDDSDGMNLPNTHDHSPEVTVAGVTYARAVELINGFTVEFEDGQYTISFSGANHNLGDQGIRVQNQVSLVINNAAGLITTSPTDHAIGLLDLVDGVEAGITVRESLRAMMAVLAGILAGAATTTITVRDQADTKNRITATVDKDGNRSAVVLDLS